MNETIKKLVLFGIGSVELTKEAVSKFMKDLEKEGALDKSEGKKVVRKTFKDLSKSLQKFEKEVEKEINKLEKSTKKPAQSKPKARKKPASKNSVK